ncbi:U3 snoRNP protein [Nowakowskiella sp. JEL0407]|nr:U3 snoRNP protein [Nowakowskiella sp. JEL0407]
MAGAVRYHLELMLPELDDLEKTGLFTKAEIKAIVKKRTALEYSIHRRIPLLSDYLKYIEYEINLEKLRSLRSSKFKTSTKTTPNNDKISKLKKQALKNNNAVDSSIIRRIHALFNKSLKKFGGDVGLWKMYFKWAVDSGAGVKALGRSFGKAIQQHPRENTFWILAASYEYNTNHNIQTARILFLRGLRINPESQELWLEYYKLEILWAVKVYARRAILVGGEDKVRTTGESVELPALNEEKDANNQLEELTKEVEESTEKQNDDETLLRIPRIIFKNAIEAIPTFEFHLKFLSVLSSQSPLFAPLITEMYDSISKHFPTSPIARSFLASKSLPSIPTNDYTKQTDFVANLKTCVHEYDKVFCDETVVDKYKVLEEFEKFVDGWSLVSESAELRKYFSTLLAKVYSRSFANGEISPASLLNWSKLESSETLEILKLGTDKFPGNGMIWGELISLSFDNGSQQLSISEIESLAKSKIAGVDEKFNFWKRYLGRVLEKYGGSWSDFDGEAADDDAMETEENDPTYIPEIQRIFNSALSHTQLAHSTFSTIVIKNFLFFIIGTTPSNFLPILSEFISWYGRSQYVYALATTLIMDLLKSKSAKNVQLIRVTRKLFDIWVMSLGEKDEKDGRVFLKAIEFEMTYGGMHGGGEFQSELNFYYKGRKWVDNEEEFLRQYEEIKMSV